jgi:hypothetical protein
MIRVILGFLIIFGAVGGLDNDQDLLNCIMVAICGMFLMAWGAFDKNAMR